MKKTHWLLSIILLTSTQPAFSNIYKDTESPVIFFAKGKAIINTTMSASGDMHFYTDNNGFDHGPTAIYQRHENQPEQKILFEVMKIPADVHVSGDGRTLYYLDYGYQPSRIYMSQHINNEWQQPVHLSDLEIASGNSMISTNSNGDKILSAGGELFQQVDGKITKLGPEINSGSSNFDPFISYKGDYLLFVREDSKGDSNIYIAFKKGASWTLPKRLPAPFNASGVDGSPYVTPDNKYLFVTSNRDGKQTVTWQIPFQQYYNTLK